MKYYIGIDIALRKSGIVVMNERGDLVHSEVLKVPPKLDLTAAVLKIYEDLGVLYHFVERTFHPSETVTVIEDVLAMAHIKAALAIHAARTAAILAYHHSNTSNKSVQYHTPNVVKQWLTGKRGAKKEVLLAALKQQFPQYNYAVLSEDEMDAIALCLYEIKGGK